MSLQDHFDNVIEENIPKLIKLISNLEADDPNFNVCKQFMQSKFKYHNFLTVNSHEIKRRMEGFFDRLRFSNLEKVAFKMNDVYERFINHPICLEHHQADIHWGILNLLLDLSHNPINVIVQKHLKNPLQIDSIFKDVPQTIINYDKELKDILDEFKAINVEYDKFSSSSDLSNWSDSDDENEFNSSSDVFSFDDNKSISTNSINEKWKIVTYLTPPKPRPHFTIFDTSISKEWVKDNIQDVWWDKKNYINKPNSKALNANFCEIWIQFIADNTIPKVKPTVSILPEYLLLREILWMFIQPTDCKFFKLDNKITLKPNASIPSVTLLGIDNFMLIFIEHMNYMFELEKFCTSILKSFDVCDKLPSLTYEAYAFCIKEFLDYIKHFLKDKESQIRSQSEIYTVIQLLSEFKEYFKLLKMLYDLHVDATLDFTRYPSHICTAYLLSQLFSTIQNFRKEQANLAFVIYLKTIRVFLTIIDTWWIEGNLDDFRNEFLIKRDYTLENTVEYKVRQFQKCKDTSFHVKPSISKSINEDSIINLLLKNLLKNASTLEMLHTLDRIGELKNENQKLIVDDINQQFYRQVLPEVFNFNSNEDDQNNNTVNSDYQTKCDYNLESIKDYDMKEVKEEPPKNEFNRTDFETELLCDGDEFLLAAFSESLNLSTNQIPPDKDKNVLDMTRIDDDSVTLYKRINNLSNISLPNEQILTNIINALLQNKCVVVNKFVTKIYKEEFQVLNFVKNLRKILLLEASDLMHYFYTGLFNQIDNGENWANSYQLTVQLNAIMSSRFSNMVFIVEILNSKNIDTLHTVKALDQIKINYNVPDTLKTIITDNDLEYYNTIFRFLLKIKWGIYTLENLRHPELHKKRLAYAPLTVVDFIIKRLAVLRIWLIYSFQSIHNYLMSEVIQVCGQKMEGEIENANSLFEIKTTHERYINTVYSHSFQNFEQNTILVGIIQLLNIVATLKTNWIVCCRYEIDSETNKIVDQLENSYIKCHQYLIDCLNWEMCKNYSPHLDSISAAFNCSVPY